MFTEYSRAGGLAWGFCFCGWHQILSIWGAAWLLRAALLTEHLCVIIFMWEIWSVNLLFSFSLKYRMDWVGRVLEDFSRVCVSSKKCSKNCILQNCLSLAFKQLEFTSNPRWDSLLQNSQHLFQNVMALRFDDKEQMNGSCLGWGWTVACLLQGTCRMELFWKKPASVCVCNHLFI